MKITTPEKILITLAVTAAVLAVAVTIISNNETAEEPTCSAEFKTEDNKLVSSFEYTEVGETKVQIAEDGHKYRIIKVRITNTGERDITPLMSWFRYDATGSKIFDADGGSYDLGGLNVMGINDLGKGVIYKYLGGDRAPITLKTGESEVLTLIFDASATHNARGDLNVQFNGKWRLVDGQ